MFDWQCVNKVSRRFLLPLFLRLVFRIQLADIFFSIACLLTSIGIIAVEFLVIGVYSQGVVSLKPLPVASQFDILPFAFCEMWLRT